MNLKNIFPFLFLFIACSSTSYIRDVNDPGKLITGRFEMQAGNRMAKPRSIKRWEFNDIKQGFYFLGTLTQDSYGALVFDDGNKDECDAYIKTLNPDFDPKSAVILKPRRHIATHRF